jgi:alpha-glucoside transport system permease protein
MVVAVAAVVALVGLSYAVAANKTVGAGIASDVGGRLLAALLGIAGLYLSLRQYRVSAASRARRTVGLVVGLAASALIWLGYLRVPKVRTTSISVLVAVGVSALLFIGANRWFDEARRSWSRYGAVTGAVLGGGLAAVLTGNRIIGLKIGAADASSIWVALILVVILAAASAVFGFVLTSSEARGRRLLVGALGGAAVGFLFGMFFRQGGFPAMKALHLVLWPVVLAGVGAAIAALRRRPILPGAVAGATIGWFVGAWVVPNFGSGTFTEAILGATVLGAGVGASVGVRPPASYAARVALERRARAVIFLAPALTFISASLVVPSLRTIYLSFFDNRSKNFVGLENYVAIKNDRGAFDFRNWTGAFSSRLFLFACVFALLALLLGFLYKRRSEGKVAPLLLLTMIPVGAALVTGMAARLRLDDPRNEVPPADGLLWLAAVAGFAAIALLVTHWLKNRGDTGLAAGGAGAPFAMSIILFAFAIFAYFRGTIFNNLWWVFTVTLFATSLGLAIAVLADRGKYESVAKSIIFMPMAISFVGAGIIWRFVFIARPEAQTGMLNAVWVGLGRMSQSGTGKAVALAVLAVLIAGLAYLALRALRGGALGVLGTSVLMSLLLAWFGYRLLGPGLGGIEQDLGERCCERTILFTQEPPWNNVWLMVVLIWIQTGFTMVIFSAAIKAVPSELIEASRVDGATESQTFWRVVVPQISPTIGVVTTTLIVLVMKVFDIVKVMGNGNFGTQVMANQMFDQAFAKFNIGGGSAWAVVLFAAILPVMVINVRRMQKEAR